MRRKMKAMKRIGLALLAASVLMGAAGSAAPAPSPWEQPAAELAARVAAILGPGQAHLTLQNLSTIPADQLPVIQKLLAQDLQARGVTDAGIASVSSLRVTLSQNARERLWVAEVIEGSETQVAMVRVALSRAAQAPSSSGILLRKQAIFTSGEELLAALQTANGLVVLEPEQIVIYAHGDMHETDAWRQVQRVNVTRELPLTRDPRGILLPSENGAGFEAWLPGTHCSGASAPDPSSGAWDVQCQPSDDPWVLQPAQQAQTAAISGAANLASATPIAAAGDSLKAFYNASRDDFTGVVVPSRSVGLPAFYSAALVPRPLSSAALLFTGIDGTVQLAENGQLDPVAGARDWGSDFALLHAACATGSEGAGTAILASGSGEAQSDSIRAYELPALEAVPVSAPLAMDGTVMALWSAPDGKSVLAIVQNTEGAYEVDRVTASCN